MKSKLIRLIISGLLIILSITSIFTYSNYKNKQAKIQQAINNKPQIEQSFKIIDKQTIINKLNLENSINVLSGEITVNEKFTNSTVSDQDVRMSFLKNWFNNSTSKDLNVSNTYKFTFSYDLKDIPVTIHNSTINIRLSYNNLSLNSVELIKTDSSERVGWLTSQFTPQQVNALNARVQSEAKNTIMSNKEYRSTCMENVKNDIKNLLQTVIGKDTNLHFDISDYDVVEQDVATIIK